MADKEFPVGVTASTVLCKPSSPWFTPGAGDLVLGVPLGGVLEDEKPELLGVLGVVVFGGTGERDPLTLHSV